MRLVQQVSFIRDPIAQGRYGAPHEAEIVESPYAQYEKACAVGFNHIALEVGDIEEALAYYGRLFDFKQARAGGGFPNSALLAVIINSRPHLGAPRQSAHRL
jgi:hypothetical protein